MGGFGRPFQYAEYRTVKIEKDGKRLSPRVKASFDATTELPELFELLKTLGQSDGQGVVTGGGWEKTAKAYTSRAADYLRSKCLPFSPMMWKTSGGEWIQDEPAEPKGRRNIHQHMKALGFDRDSLEDLAARVISRADTLRACCEKGRLNSAVYEAMELERAALLFRVYRMESEGGAKGGKKSKRRRWAETIAMWLKQRTDGMTKDEAWKAIPERLEEIEDDEGDVQFYRDGDVLVALVDGIEQRGLSKTTFLKRYFRNS
jgi:hypothetical protein